MAATYTIATTGVSFAANKSMISVFNASGSGQIIRLYRAWILNNQTAAVTGVLTNIELRRITSGSGGSASTPQKHDSTSASFPAQIVAGSGLTVTTTDLFRRIVWSTDEPVANATASIDEFQCIVPFNCVWDVGYNDANVEPIVCREGEGVSIQNIGATVGVADFFFEVTMAAS